MILIICLTLSILCLCILLIMYELERCRRRPWQITRAFMGKKRKRAAIRAIQHALLDTIRTHGSITNAGVQSSSKRIWGQLWTDICHNAEKRNKVGGAEMSHAERCPVCHGSGQVETVPAVIPAVYVACHGCPGSRGWVEVEDDPLQRERKDYAENDFSERFHFKD